MAAERYNRAAALSPLADGPRRGLMEALAQGGDRNGALDVYRQFTDLLRAEINVEPEEETTRLYLQLRRQIREDGRGATPRSVPAKLAGHLPHPVANLVGREEERVEVGSEIRRSRLVTLVGPGGIGKTRLAIETAREIAKEYPDGAWLVALEALANEDLFERHVASVFELREEPGRSLASVLADYLRTKRLLLVLDNCEHLLRPSARFVDGILRDCAGVKILATSRESLGLSGERIWSVPSLPYPNLDHLPESPSTRRRVLAGYESVELFVERATAAHRDFTLTSHNAPAIAQICAHVEGMPLAIELAAARTRAMTVDEIAERLGEGLSLLSGGRNLPARQRTLRATLDWSYELLSEDEQRILGRLSVFSGGWTLRAAEQVVGGGEIAEAEVIDLLESLVDKSFVWFEDARGRYRLSEPVRQYALEKLETSEDSESVKRAHTEWCVAFAETADAHLRGRDHRVWMARLLEDRDNLRSALDRWPTLALAAALGRFWYIRGDYGEGTRYLTKALADAADGPAAVRAKALAALAELHFGQSEYAEAKEGFQASFELGHIGSRSRLAWLAHEQGEDHDALRLVEESLAAARLFDDRSGIASCLITKSEILMGRSGGSSGIELIAEALPIYRALEDEIGTANCLVRLAYAYRFTQAPAETQRQFLEALGIFKALDDRSGIATSHFNLAQEAMRIGDYSDAAAHWRESLRIYLELGERRGIVLAMAFLGKALAMAGELPEAKELVSQSLSLSRSVSAKGSAITSIECFAVLLTRMQRYDLVTQLLAYSNLLRRKIGIIRGPQGSAEHAKRMADSLAALGEEGFRKEWEIGEGLDVDRILSLASGL
jgi:predicted ATPase